MPAALRYPLIVSRRTPTASSMRRSDHPSRPSARISSCFSGFKTLAILPGEAPLSRAVNVHLPASYWPGFTRPQLAGFDRPPRPGPIVVWIPTGGAVCRVRVFGYEAPGPLALRADPRAELHVVDVTLEPKGIE